MSNDTPQDEPKSERFNMFISKSEMEAIDDWRFDNRVTSRSEAVRRLCQMGIRSEVHLNALAVSLVEMNMEIEVIENKWHRIVDELEKIGDPKIEDDFYQKNVTLLFGERWSFVVRLYQETLRKYVDAANELNTLCDNRPFVEVFQKFKDSSKNIAKDFAEWKTEADRRMREELDKYQTDNTEVPKE